jgi:hypothetical protein
VAIFKQILPSDVKTQKSYLSSMIDILQEDVSASVSRRKYQHFVTGGIGPGVTSSLFQTVYDQDLTYSTANPIFDVTVGLYAESTIVDDATTGVDAAGKELFQSSSLMMREKMDIYRQFAHALLGDSDAVFKSSFDSTDTADQINAAMFISFKRLFARDSITRETFAMQFYQSASAVSIGAGNVDMPPSVNSLGITNISSTSISGSVIFTDVGSSVNKLVSFGGQVGNIVDASNTARNVGLMFYDRGVAVFDLEKITSASQFISGTISAMHANGTITLGGAGTQTHNTAKFIPDMFVSASIDDIIDHLCYTRFSSGSFTAMTFQNTTNINSTLVFCRAAADEFNYSSNPTYVDSENRIVVIDPGQEDTQTSFTYITGVGLYDANSNLLAVGKSSRPIEKSAERDLTLRLRLDF